MDDRSQAAQYSVTNPSLNINTIAITPPNNINTNNPIVRLSILFLNKVIIVISTKITEIAI